MKMAAGEEALTPDFEMPDYRTMQLFASKAVWGEEEWQAQADDSDEAAD